MKTRQFILGLLLFLCGIITTITAKLEWFDEEYLKFSIGLLISIYVFYHSLKLIKKSIN